MNLLERLAKLPQFVKERAIWIASGRPVRSPKGMENVYNICVTNECGAFENGSCGICGCGLHPSRKQLNKIYWATTYCPHEKRYWTNSAPRKEVDEGALSAARKEDLREEVQNRDCGCK